jgi:hypothetical protein
MDAGLTLTETAELLCALGRSRRSNLDGGASAALVRDHRLCKRPRSDDGDVRGGRPVTAITFQPRTAKPSP